MLSTARPAFDTSRSTSAIKGREECQRSVPLWCAVAGLIVLLLVGFKRTISWLWVGFKWIMMSLLAFAAAFVLIMIVGNVVFATKRNEPHRNLHPQHADCHNPDG